MANFIRVHDINDNMIILFNQDEISRIEQRPAGCLIYTNTTADDFDKTRHQIGVHVAEDIAYFIRHLDVNWLNEKDEIYQRLEGHKE